MFLASTAKAAHFNNTRLARSKSPQLGYQLTISANVTQRRK